jgi:hypothetical protein
MSDLPVGMIVFGVIVEVVFVGGLLIWSRSLRKK